MILPERVLGGLSTNWIASGRGNGPEVGGDVLAEFFLEFLRGPVAFFEVDEAVDGLSFQLVGQANAAVSNGRMCEQRRFDLCGAQAVA